MPPVRFLRARWFILLLIALLPAQAALAAGGALCSIAHRSHDTIASPAHTGPAHGALAHDASANAQASNDVDGQLPPGERSTCSACAPYSGSLALSGVPSLGPAAVTTTGDDFLPVLVVLRPARSDGLERPPRTI